MTSGKAGGLSCERLKGADKTIGRPRRHQPFVLEQALSFRPQRSEDLESSCSDSGFPPTRECFRFFSDIDRLP
jgi:hypothetical protein